MEIISFLQSNLREIFYFENEQKNSEFLVNHSYSLFVRNWENSKCLYHFIGEMTYVIFHICVFINTNHSTKFPYMARIMFSCEKFLM